VDSESQEDNKLEPESIQDNKKDEKSEKPIIRAPQISYVDGKLQINKSSLEVDLAAEDEDEHEKADSEKKRGRRKKEKSEKWSQEETDKFYKALQIFGTDFSIIAKLLPGRTRKQIKNKFNREEKDPDLRKKIDLFLKQANSCSLEDFQGCYGKVDELAKGLGENEKYVKEKIAAHIEKSPNFIKSDESSELEELPKIDEKPIEKPIIEEETIVEKQKIDIKPGKINLF